MPDWCENKLYITGDNDAVSLFCRNIENEYKNMHKKVLKTAKREHGKCVYWNEQKGYGFLKTDNDYDIFDEDNYGDIFVHCSAIHANGHRILQKDEYVFFDLIIQSDGRKKAINVTGPNGRYVDGNYDWTQNKPKHEVKIQCYGLKRIYLNIDKNKTNQHDDADNINNIDKSSSDRPSVTNSFNNMPKNGAIYTFSTMFEPPRGWIACAAKKYSKYNISLRLMYQTENEVCYGCIMYQKGICFKRYQVSGFDLMDRNSEIFESLLRDGMQHIFNKAVTENVSSYEIDPNLQTLLLGFCPQYLLNQGLLSEFMNIWNNYANDTNYKVSKDSVLFEIFNSIENKIDSIFCENGVEIIDRFSIRFGFWDKQYGLFKNVVSELFTI